MSKHLPVASDAFKKYGVVIRDLDLSDMIEAAKEIPMPEQGVFYKASIAELENTEGFRRLQDRFGGGCPIQAGMCWGYNEYMGGMEYHRSSELNVAVTDYVAALGDRRDIVENTYEADKAETFFVPAGQAVEIYATTLHLAPCSAVPEGFKTIVVLPKGTNHPLSPELKAQAAAAQGEHRLLNATDNWAITFPGTDSEKAGLYPGMLGENRRCAGFDEQ